YIFFFILSILFDILYYYIILISFFLYLYHSFPTRRSSDLLRLSEEKSFCENTSLRMLCSMKLRSPTLTGRRTVRCISPATGTCSVTRGSTVGIISPR